MIANPGASDLWRHLRVLGNVYETCVELGYCGRDPNKAAGDYTPCHRALSDDWRCEIEPKCDAVKQCSTQCYTCNRLVREWPIFMETCKPPGANVNDEVEVPTPQVPSASASSFISHSQQVQQTQGFPVAPNAVTELSLEDQAFIADAASGRAVFNEFNAARARRIQEAIQSGAVNPAQLQAVAEVAAAESITSINPDLPSVFMELSTTVRARAASKNGAKPPPQVRGGVNLDDVQTLCHAKWREFSQSRRSRYFLSYKKTTMPELNPDDIIQSLGWDAHSTCKCLQAGCPMQPGETLELLGTCQYNRMHELIMKMAFPNVANP